MQEVNSVDEKIKYVGVILPLALEKLYTYAIPGEMADSIAVGKRVEVEFGRKKRYAAVIAETYAIKPVEYRTKPIITILDDVPILDPIHLKFWKWMADYYCCTVGEVMHAALPAGLKMNSETSIISGINDETDLSELSDDAYLLAEALTVQQELSIKEVREILDRKHVFPVLEQLIQTGLIYLKESLVDKYKPKLTRCIRLNPIYLEDSTMAFELTARAPKQTEALLTIYQLQRDTKFLTVQAITKSSKISSATLKALAQKEIIEIYEIDPYEMGDAQIETSLENDLNSSQIEVEKLIQENWKEKQTVLLHGITGSGKTHIYIDLIKKELSKKRQILFLLPEIGLTAQMIGRLKRFFGKSIAIYHSRLNTRERVEVWRQVRDGIPIVLSARSGLFLPFVELGLVIIDESHDSSYKQRDPDPRYQGRDSGVYLAKLFDAKVLMGTATPSLETLTNVRKHRYGYVRLAERFGASILPEISVVKLLANRPSSTSGAIHISEELLNSIQKILNDQDQVLLFRNRRGYAPVLMCPRCHNWRAVCNNCDVSLTYHKYKNNLKCHYCGHEENKPDKCPACGYTEFVLKGFGTEQVEEELKIFFPHARIRRMDYDTVKGKNAHSRILREFEMGLIDVLVGTQMISKGLDFSNVKLVGILNADALFHFPDFRANETAMQLLMQVSGRAGRTDDKGRVIIQAENTNHPVLVDFINSNWESFIERELEDRSKFLYPPYFRLIDIIIKHKKNDVTFHAADILGKKLRAKLGRRVIGPAPAVISRIGGYYIYEIKLKMEHKFSVIAQIKKILLEKIEEVHKVKGLSSVRINIDVDPQ
jgi:primosomal protein N' (replication factor Y)